MIMNYEFENACKEAAMAWLHLLPGRLLTRTED